MKTMKCILLFVVYVAMAACGNAQNNKELYKNQYLDAWAKDMGTTKEYLMKDLDISINEIKIIPITVADSIAILEDIGKDGGRQIRELKSLLSQMKQMEGLLALSGETEKVKEAKAFIKNMPSEIASLERAIKEDLPRYNNMDKQQVLANVFSCLAAVLDSKSGVHKVEPRKAVFNTNGELDKFTCPMTLDTYLKHNSKLD